MRVLVIGGGGMLGHKLVQMWNDKFEVWTTIRKKKSDYERYKFFDEQRTIENTDVEDFQAIENIVRRIKPQVIVNAVGIIKQVPTAKDVINTLSINSIFPHKLAELTERTQCRLISLSTDCVFSGRGGNYKENDEADALDLYGKSKQIGEVTAKKCLTLRTSIIGRELDTAHSLVEWFLSNRGKSVKGFKKAIFSGFPTVILADILADVIENYSELSGLYHLSSEPINKFDLLQLIKRFYKVEISIEPFDDFVIDRSLDSTRFREATGFKPLKWNDMIEKMADDNAVYN